MEIGDNVNATVKGNVLTITCKLDENFGPSASGKTTILASTRGAQSVRGTDAKLSLNFYTKR